jgi:hypothetical protein
MVALEGDETDDTILRAASEDASQARRAPGESRAELRGALEGGAPPLRPSALRTSSRACSDYDTIVINRRVGCLVPEPKPPSLMPKIYKLERAPLSRFKPLNEIRRFLVPNSNYHQEQQNHPAPYQDKKSAEVARGSYAGA